MATESKSTIPETIDGVMISVTHRVTPTGGETHVKGLRYRGDDPKAEAIGYGAVVPDGDAYPEQAILNAAWAVAKKVNNDFHA